MQFVVPQFIEVESKIIGPISARQFVIMLVGAGLLFLLYKFAPFWLLIVGGAMVFGTVVMFGFVKIHSQPFHWFFLSLVQTLRRPRLRLWFRDEFIFREKAPKKEKDQAKVVARAKVPVSNSRLAEMALLVDTGGAYMQPELIQKPTRAESSVVAPAVAAPAPVQPNQPPQQPPETPQVSVNNPQ
ncbi:MAG: PrgI family protein [Patescibacteria group bacterium]